MIGLIKNGELVTDELVYVPDGEPIPEDGGVIVHLAAWQADRERLLRRGTPVGVRLQSDQAPDLIADDLPRLAVVALEFPAFRDGRAYSYARMLRERYRYTGEVRAVGDVLMEQIHFMLRTGFDAFEIEAEDPLGDFRAAVEDFSVWYQPTGDGRPTAMQLRHGRGRQA
jgi:uncharacterized protein (DUF934 family)